MELEEESSRTTEMESGGKPQEDKSTSITSGNLTEEAVQEGRMSPPLTEVVTTSDGTISENDCTEDIDGHTKSRIPLLMCRISPIPKHTSKNTTEPIDPVLQQNKLSQATAAHEFVSEGFTEQQQTELMDQLLQVKRDYDSDSPLQTLNPDNIQESISPKISTATDCTNLQTDRKAGSIDMTSPSSLVSPTRISHDSSPHISLGDPTAELKTMSDHPSYHSNVTGRRAEEILKKHGGSCYLTRHSKSNNCYVLSVLKTESRKARISHFMLKINEQSLYGHHVISEIEGTNLQFANIFKLLEFYEKNPVSHEFRNIGTMIKSDEYNGDFHHVGKPISSDETGISIFTVSKPTLSDLVDLSWSEGGRVKHYKLTREISGAWREAGLILGICIDTLDDYEQNSQCQWNHSCMERILNHWLNSNHSKYPPTWDGLFSLLHDLERKSAIDMLKTALSWKK